MLLNLYACVRLLDDTSQYEDWQTVEIKECGTMKIPGEWSWFTEDGTLYILDENAEPVMIQCHNYATGVRESNKYYKNYKYLEFLSNKCLSNGAFPIVCKFLHEDEVLELRLINLGDVILIVWKTDLQEDIFDRIVKSFIQAMSE